MASYRVLKYDGPRRGCLGFLCCCCVGLPQAVVTVKLECATELAKQDMIGKGEWEGGREGGRRGAEKERGEQEGGYRDGEANR